MKKLLLPLVACVIALFSFISCNDIEKQAGVKLQEAKAAFEQGKFDVAKQLFDTRKASLALQREVELAEQRQLVDSIDSELAEKRQAIEDIKDHFVLEKDEQYQRIGNYFDKSQTVEKNIHRSFLRFQVSEEGKLSMTSTYCGASNIHHTAVKVTAPDGSSAATT